MDIWIFELASLGDSLVERVKIFGTIILDSFRSRFLKIHVHREPSMRWGCDRHGIRFPLFISGARDEYVLIHEMFFGKVYDVHPQFSVKTIVDCGAEIGASVLSFCTRFPDARIIAVEPNPHGIAILKRIAVEMSRIIPIHAAISEEDGEQTFFVDDQLLSSSLTRRNESALATIVPGRNLSSIMKAADIEHIDLLKFDIEGAEEYLFTSTKVNKSIRSFIGELHPDLMHMTLKEFIALVEQDFSITLSPTNKEGRFMVYGISKHAS